MRHTEVSRGIARTQRHVSKTPLTCIDMPYRTVCRPMTDNVHRRCVQSDHVVEFVRLRPSVMTALTGDPALPEPAGRQGSRPGVSDRAVTSLARPALDTGASPGGAPPPQERLAAEPTGPRAVTLWAASTDATSSRPRAARPLSRPRAARPEPGARDAPAGAQATDHDSDGPRLPVAANRAQAAPLLSDSVTAQVRDAVDAALADAVAAGTAAAGLTADAQITAQACAQLLAVLHEQVMHVTAHRDAALTELLREQPNASNSQLARQLNMSRQRVDQLKGHLRSGGRKPRR